MELTYEQHNRCKEMIREKATLYELPYSRISTDIGLDRSVLSAYLNNRRVLSTSTIRKIFNKLRLDFSSFEKAIAATEETAKAVYLVKRGNFYYGGRKKIREYSFGWIVFFVEVYTAKQYKANVFKNLKTAKNVAKQIDGQVIRLEKRKW